MNSETTTYTGKLPKSLERFRKKLCDYSYEGEDGHFLYLKAGMRREPCDMVHFIQADTVREAIERFSWVVPCDCEDCKIYLAK
jgi:hypothetical protein